MSQEGIDLVTDLHRAIGRRLFNQILVHREPDHLLNEVVFKITLYRMVLVGPLFES